MVFWVLAAVALTLAAFITCLPLFRPKTGWTRIAFLLVFLLPASALLVYQYTGTPAALDQVAVATQATGTNESPDIDALVASLRAKLTPREPALIKACRELVEPSRGMVERVFQRGAK